VQGFPIYYESFFLETPQARDWLARSQSGESLCWGAQTFRYWIDPTRCEFHDYTAGLLQYVLKQFKPASIFIDNTIPPQCYTDSARESFRAYLRRKYAGQDAVKEFGIASFDAVELPYFSNVYNPPDSYAIVKDPLLQEWAYWNSQTSAGFVAKMCDAVHAASPDTKFCTTAGCDVLRFNHLFIRGSNFEDRIACCDHVHMEESAWRPGVFALQGEADDSLDVRVSTDARWWKIYQNYGKAGHGQMWGEIDRPSKLVAIAHDMAFAQNADNLGIVGPLAAHDKMLDDIADVLDWGRRHIDVLAGREDRIAPVAVWRGSATLGFIRHQPVWEACAIEQMLFEQHVPFTILLDGGLERFLTGREVLILPGTECVSDRQAEIITRFVDNGGSLLLLGRAGTRDGRVRLRSRLAFDHLMGGALGNMEFFGPPHWVPELDFSAMPEKLSASFGKGKISFIKTIKPRTTFDMTRDQYWPHREVAVGDILPPANESAIMDELDKLLTRRVVRVNAPRWTLCEFWRKGATMQIALANLRKTKPGGPVTVDLRDTPAAAARWYEFGCDVATPLKIRNGRLSVASLEHFGIIEIDAAIETP
ncbi:MAG: hypothetical protein EHM48_05015, partial [Planctomycetaceae bacterium]